MARRIVQIRYDFAALRLRQQAGERMIRRIHFLPQRGGASMQAHSAIPSLSALDLDLFKPIDPSEAIPLSDEQLEFVKHHAFQWNCPIEEAILLLAASGMAFLDAYRRMEMLTSG